MRLSAIAVCFGFAVTMGLPLSTHADEPKTPKSVLLETARAAPDGRRVQVVVGQVELGSNINPSYVMVAMGGGLIGGLIDAKVQSDRARRATIGITPIRTSLMDFDVDQLAIDTTKSAVAALPWFAAAEPDFARDPTVSARSAYLDAAGAGQVAFFEYVYDTSPDFSAVRVGVTISIANRQGAEAERRLTPRNLVFKQTLTSVVLLPTPGEAAANSQRWAANDAAPAKRAVTAAFAEIGRLIPRALTLTTADIARMNGGARKELGSYSGKFVEDGPGGTLLFTGGLVHVQTLAE